MVGVNWERAIIPPGEELTGSGATRLSQELVSWFMADWIPHPKGVNQILFSGNLELGLGEGRVRISNWEAGSEWVLRSDGLQTERKD